MPKFRKRPVEIEAIQILPAGEACSEEWLSGLYELMGGADWESGGHESLIIHTLEGDMRADPGDWIIRGIKGEIYPCKPDIFSATYDLVSTEETQSDVSAFLDNSLREIAVNHAVELERNRKMADEIGGLLTMSAKATVSKGPLSDHVIKLSIEIDPEDEQ